MSATAAPAPGRTRTRQPRPGPVRLLLRGLLAGGLGVLAGWLVGVALAAVAVGAGLAAGPVPRLGSVLTGLGLLGAWAQTVTSDVAAGWTATVMGPPLLVTGTVLLVVALATRGLRRSAVPLAAAGAVVGAAGTAAVVALLSATTETSAGATGGTATSATGLAPWTCALGAAVLAAVATGWWLLPRTGPWADARRDALAVLVGPGLVLTLAAAAGIVWLTSSPSVGLLTALLAPLLGTQALLVAGLAPATVAIPRLTDGTLTVWTPEAGGALATVLAVVLLVVAVLVGLLRRRRHGPPALVPGAVCGAVAGAVLALVGGVRGGLPDGLGGSLTVAVLPWAAALVGATLTVIAGALAGVGRYADDVD